MGKTVKALIKTLYPGEVCLSHDRLSQFESDAYQFCKENHLPKVAVLSNGKRIVRDGNHRIYSEIQKGRKYVSVCIQPASNRAEIKFLSRTIKVIEFLDQKGFSNMTLCETREECKSLTLKIEQEFKRHQIQNGFQSAVIVDKKKI